MNDKRINNMIEKYKDSHKEQVLTIWEKSVRATHDFLSPADFLEIRALLGNIDWRKLHVFCLTEEDIVMGFVCVEGRKIDMLFLDPYYFGQGFGRKLLNFAVKELNADSLDVNEQNTKALKFYQKFGFEIMDRSEKDDQGRSYPLLRMKLVEKN